MDDGYTWREMRESTPLRLPGPDNLGWWAAVAFFIAIILHVAAFFALGHIKIALGFEDLGEIQTASIHVDQVEVLPPDYEMPAPEDDVAPPPPEAASLLEEIDILAKLPENSEIDLRPDLTDPEFAIHLNNPALEGEPAGLQLDPADGFDLDTALPEIGRTEDPLPLAADAQTIVDPGAVAADDTNLDKFAEDLLKKGAGGNLEAGTLDGVVTLDDMVGLPADVLVGKKTMLPSDLLFDYNSAELRESARLGLMKLALIINLNPNLHCWIEGYSDLYGTDAYNIDLSRRRAAAVKEYLTGTLSLGADKIATRGFGKARPLVLAGTADEQAPNRRVEIRMRPGPPPPEEAVVTPPAPPTPVAPTPATPPPAAPAPRPKPVLVKPMRALPVVEEDPPPPRATTVPEEAPPMKALPVEEPPRAAEVEEPPPRRAEPVE